MPLIHRRQFRIRSYECDAHGHLNNANYARFMQETAFDATSSAGYGLARYAQMQRQWLVRATGMEFLQPLHYDDQIEINTWISDFRRASSRRQYEFRRVGSGEVTTRGWTDWVFIDTTSQRPVSIPTQLAGDFFPEGVPAEFPPRPAFPEAPPAPSGAFCMRRQVQWNDIDTLQHVNNAVYLNYITECSMQSLAACGWSWQRLYQLGLAVFLRRCQIQYLLPALLGEELEIQTWISNLRRVSAERHYTIRRTSDGALLARAQTYSAWVDLASGQPARIPQELVRDCGKLIA